MTALKAGVAYFTLIFALGFVLGAIRVLLLLPYVGEIAAVLIEGPFILAASWVVCGVLIRRFNVAAQVSPRALMGASALALLLLAEVLLGVYGFGRTLSEHFAHYATTPGVIGLAGQTLFGAFPMLHLLVEQLSA